MPALLQVVGYAIISNNGMIADAVGRMPPQLMNEADQKFFSQGLDEAEVVVHGRHSQEQDGRASRRQRLIATRQVSALAPQPDNPRAMLWNPAGATLEDACKAFDVSQGVVAVIGGPQLYAAFLPRYDAFHLTRATQATISNGRPVFPGIPPNTPDEILQRHGLSPCPEQTLDGPAGIMLCTWRRSG
jgi:dihydrofolate reductase